MDLRRAQAVFNESGAINLIRVSNVGGVAGRRRIFRSRAQGLRLSWRRGTSRCGRPAVKADDHRIGALHVGRDATDLFLVMGAVSAILAGVLLIVNIFVMLAEERKPELGVAAALVVFLRSDLLTNVRPRRDVLRRFVAAALGSLAGLGLGSIMVYFFDKLVPHGNVVVTLHFDLSLG